MSIPGLPDGRSSSLGRTAGLFYGRTCLLLSTGDPFPKGLLRPRIPAPADKPLGGSFVAAGPPVSMCLAGAGLFHLFPGCPC